VITRNRIQFSITLAELAVIDNWRFEHRKPSRVAAIRRLLRFGLQSRAQGHVDRPKRYQDFRVLDQNHGAAGGTDEK
jgi:hypothetical protein